MTRNLASTEIRSFKVLLVPVFIKNLSKTQKPFCFLYFMVIRDPNLVHGSMTCLDIFLDWIKISERKKKNQTFSKTKTTLT